MRPTCGSACKSRGAQREKQLWADQKALVAVLESSMGIFLIIHSLQRLWLRHSTTMASYYTIHLKDHVPCSFQFDIVTIEIILLQLLPRYYLVLAPG